MSLHAPLGIILAAGRSTRMWPLTALAPKALLPYGRQTILEHTISCLSPHVREIVVVVGHGAALVEQHLAQLTTSVPVRTVRQETLDGTGGALRALAAEITGPLLVVNGDDIYSPTDITSLAATELGILAASRDDAQAFGLVEVEGGKLRTIQEKTGQRHGLVNTGAYRLDARIVDALQALEPSPRGELELTDAVTSLAREHAVSVVTATQWIPVGYPWDILTANAAALHEITSDIRGTVHPQAVIEGSVVIEQGVQILSGVVIQGPAIIRAGSVVGPNAYIRAGSVIGERCFIGQGVEIKNTILESGVRVAHLSYLGDSVIGRGANIAGGTITANLRHDFAPLRVMTSRGMVQTTMPKLGAFVGPFARTGVHTTLAAGVMLGCCSWTDSGVVIREHLSDFHCNGKRLTWEKLSPSLLDARADAYTLAAAQALHDTDVTA